MAHPVPTKVLLQPTTTAAIWKVIYVLTEASQSRGSRKVKGIGSEFSNSSVVPETSLLATL